MDYVNVLIPSPYLRQHMNNYSDNHSIKKLQEPQSCLFSSSPWSSFCWLKWVYILIDWTHLMKVVSIKQSRERWKPGRVEALDDQGWPACPDLFKSCNVHLCWAQKHAFEQPLPLKSLCKRAHMLVMGFLFKTLMFTCCYASF